MSVFSLKIIAIISMLIDHIGYIFFPDVSILRILGRVAMPVFCFLIANGYRHTKSVKGYAFRLFVFAFVSQIPFMLFVGGVGMLNVFFTLLFGLLCIIALDKQNMFIASVIILSLMAASYVLNTDYSFYGILFIIFYHLCYDSKMSLALVTIILSVIMGYINKTPLQYFAVLSMVPICLYNKTAGKFKFKYLFYLFYPVHLLILYFISLVVS